MQLGDPRPQPGIQEVTDSTLLGFQDFLESSAPDLGKILLRQKYFRPGMVNLSTNVNIFPDRKSKPYQGHEFPAKKRKPS